jgi:uncharacterized protein (DUF433 family)
MELVLEQEAPPLRAEPNGALRVGNSRVLLELVIRAFEDGATPEAIAQRYPTTTLADIYSVIAYYLRHRQAVDEYVAERERRGTALQREIEQQQGDLRELRARLASRRPQADK